MSLETFLVKLNMQCPPAVLDSVAARITEMNGRILLRLIRAKTLIVAIDSRYRNALTSLPQVSHVGGIQFNPNLIRRIQVDSAGKTIHQNNRKENYHGFT